VSSSLFTTVPGAYADGKITYNETYYKKGWKLNSTGQIKFTTTKDMKMTILLSQEKANSVTVNGTEYTGTANEGGHYYEINNINVTANTEYVLSKTSGKESIVSMVILEPIE
jgi:hypothetical protein